MLKFPHILTLKGVAMKKIAIVLAFGFFGFVAFGETLDSSTQASAESQANVDSQTQQEAQAQANPSTQADLQTQSDSNAQANSNGDSQAVSSAQAATSEQTSTQQDIELKYPNSDWEVWSEIDTSEWGKKEAECNALDKGAERDKCKSAQVKKFHKLCKSRGDDKSCVLKIATLASDEVKSEDIDILYKTCDKEYASACAFYGKVVGELGDKANEARLYEKACELGSAMGCLGMGKSYFEQTKDTLKAKPYIDKYIDKAVSLADRGCKGGFEVACKQLDNINKLKAEIDAKAQAQSQAAQEANAGKKSKKSKK